MSVSFRGLRMADEGFLTKEDVLAAYVQFGPLSINLVKKAMGPNWEPEMATRLSWDEEHPDG